MAKKKVKKKLPKKRAAARKPSKKPAPKKRVPQISTAKKAAAQKRAPQKSTAKKAAAKRSGPRKPAAKTKRATKPAPRRPAPERLPIARPHRTYVEEPFVSRSKRNGDELAEELGFSFLQSATSGEESALELQNEPTEEENGGPFIETTAEEEFADDIDESNPEDAEPAALPTAISSDFDEE